MNATMTCKKCNANFNVVMASCGTGYSWSLFKCPNCEQLHATGRYPIEVENDDRIIKEVAK